MEVGLGPNEGCSAKGKKKVFNGMMNPEILTSEVGARKIGDCL
jgi:hypothetical protein